MTDIKVSIDDQKLEDIVCRAVKRAMAEYLPTNGSTATTSREDDLIDSKEACRILGCGERTLQRYRSARLLNVPYRGPHRCLYFMSEVIEFRNANMRPSRDQKR